MGRVIFASDLDNTLLFSHRHREAGDVCAERLSGREQSFFPAHGPALLAQVCQRASFIPVTTRSVEQYQRIQWPPGCVPEYAVAANGGVLLRGGARDPQWYARTLALAKPWLEELERVRALIPQAPEGGRWGEGDGLFLYCAWDRPEQAQAGASFFAGRTGLDAAVSGRKLYLLPPPVNKGEALRRLRERFRPSRVLCAGDSGLDLPMLREADLAILPPALAQGEELPGARVHRGPERFSEFVPRAALEGLDF